MTEVKKDIAFIREGHEEMKNAMDKGFKEISEKIDCLDSKFSAKWVEKGIIWAASIVGLAALTGLIALMVKSAFYFFD